MIVSKQERRQKLRESSVPIVFLDALTKIDTDEALRFMIREPDSFYFYLDEFYPKYNCLKDYNINPIFENSNGDVFYVHLFNSEESKFAHFELENDELLSDHQNSFNLMLANLLIDLYEFADDLSIDGLIVKGEKLGAFFSSKLFSELEKADEMSLRRSFDLDKKWRRDNLGRIIKSN